MVTGVGLMYTFFDFLSTLLGRVPFLAFCEHDGLVVMELVYVGRVLVLADSTLSVSAGGTPFAHKWWSG